MESWRGQYNLQTWELNLVKEIPLRNKECPFKMLRINFVYHEINLIGLPEVVIQPA